MASARLNVERILFHLVLSLESCAANTVNSNSSGAQSTIARTRNIRDLADLQSALHAIAVNAVGEFDRSSPNGLYARIWI